MKTILRRLDRIEQSLAPKPTAQDRRMAELAELLLERRRRRLGGGFAVSETTAVAARLLWAAPPSTPRGGRVLKRRGSKDKPSRRGFHSFRVYFSEAPSTEIEPHTGGGLLPECAKSRQSPDRREERPGRPANDDDGKLPPLRVIIIV